MTSVEKKRCLLSRQPEICEPFPSCQRCENEGLWEDFVSSTQNCSLAPVHPEGLRECSSSKSESLSSASKQFRNPSSLDLIPSRLYQGCCDQIPRSPNTFPSPINSSSGIARPDCLAAESMPAVTVPCHAIFCAYSTTQEALTLKALLKETARLHALKAHKTYDVRHGRMTPQTPCCGGGIFSPFPSECGLSTRHGQSPPRVHRSIGRASAWSRPSCLLCEQSSGSSGSINNSSNRVKLRRDSGRSTVLCTVSLSCYCPSSCTTSQCHHHLQMQLHYYTLPNVNMGSAPGMTVLAHPKYT